MQSVACGEAVSGAEIAVAGCRAEVVRLGNGQKSRLFRVGKAADLGGADAHRDHLTAGKRRACGDVRAERDPEAFVQHLPHRRDAAAQVDVGVRAVRDDNTGLTDGAALARIRVDAVRHDGAVLPQTEFIVALPVPRAVGVQLAHPRDLIEVFRKMRLHIQTFFRRDLSERGHQLIRAGRSEARRQDRLDVGEAAAFFEPAQCLADGVSGGLLKIFAAVAVHVYLADKAGHARTFQLLHQHERCVRMQGGEHAHTCGAVRDEVARESAVDAARVAEVSEFRFDREGVGFQPVEQRQIHARADVRELRRVQMHISERLHDELSGAVEYLAVEILRLLVQHLADRAVVIEQQRAVRDGLECSEHRCVDDVALQKFHIFSSFP